MLQFSGIPKHPGNPGPWTMNSIIRVVKKGRCCHKSGEKGRHKNPLRGFRSSHYAEWENLENESITGMGTKTQKFDSLRIEKRIYWRE